MEAFQGNQMSISLSVEARAIGSGLQSRGFGFDPTAIITIALTLWQVCLRQRDPEANPAELLRARFNGGKFDEGILQDARPNARRANRIAFRRGESPKRRLSDDELDQLTTAAFLHVLDADDEVLTACASEAEDSSADFDGEELDENEGEDVAE
jgi:hypothetical protein